jgi:phosphoribosyl-ATP pyrophosphohydrolase/phosphoribosyl-AMP cyclohydrolase
MNQGELDLITYDAQGLVPAVVQERCTGQVLMVAYMNRESLRMSLETGFTHFWSRSRRKFWKKGEESGHVQRIREIRYDCDADCLLVTVDQTGPACHTREKSCFFRVLGGGDACPVPAAGGDVLDRLEEVIRDRKANPQPGSHVTRLLAGGPEAAREKVAEESGETLEASREGDRRQIVYESADLLFHLMVLLASHDLTLAQVRDELASRFGNPPRKNGVPS